MLIGGVSAAFVNSGLVTLAGLILIRGLNLPITGGVLAGFMTAAGFSFFGKDLYNSIPIALGCYLYAKIRKVPTRTVALSMFFGTSLAPAVSFISFGLGLPWSWGLPLAWFVGLLIGFVIPILSGHFLTFHQGYNLYNTGFTAGIIGMTLVGTLRLFNVEVSYSRSLYHGSDLSIKVGLLIFFLVLIIFGFFRNGRSFRGYRKLLRESGRLSTDFLLIHDDGLTYMNIGFCGLIILCYVVLSNATINGPVLGSILTAVGFASFGLHPRNITPILIGTFAANHFGIHDITTTGPVLTGLFGTCLAPVAGQFGFIAGITAGVLHTAMVNNIGFLHGGLNLYNNGFSGGFVAAVLVPILEFFTNITHERRIPEESADTAPHVRPFHHPHND